MRLKTYVIHVQEVNIKINIAVFQMAIFLQTVQLVQQVNIQLVVKKTVQTVVWVLILILMHLPVLFVHSAIMEVQRGYLPLPVVAYVQQDIMEIQQDKQLAAVVAQQQRDFILLQVL